MSGEPMKSERIQPAMSGYGMIVVVLGLVVAAVWMFVQAKHTDNAAWGLTGGALVILHLICWGGFFMLQPKQAGVVTLFGTYKSTVVDSGLKWINPFANVVKISLRSRNLNGNTIKVNDKRGNPIEIAAVVVWRVKDTYAAAFDVENYESYVAVQSESALRHLASSYAYDSGEDDNEMTLRGGTDEVSEALKRELHQRLSKAGVEVEEARISHLAYSPEIAQAMLRRQQAEAVISARKKIVQGAVSMVEMALNELSAKKVVTLDEERKAAMVSNLLVVLCSESEAQPVLNTGTLYNG
ncbi:MAG: SPFH domain-containing protein [Planctomycetota bacterium]